MNNSFLKWERDHDFKNKMLQMVFFNKKKQSAPENWCKPLTIENLRYSSRFMVNVSKSRATTAPGKTLWASATTSLSR